MHFPSLISRIECGAQLQRSHFVLNALRIRQDFVNIASPSHRADQNQNGRTQNGKTQALVGAEFHARTLQLQFSSHNVTTMPRPQHNSHEVITTAQKKNKGNETRTLSERKRDIYRQPHIFQL